MGVILGYLLGVEIFWKDGDCLKFFKFWRYLFIKCFIGYYVYGEEIYELFFIYWFWFIRICIEVY